VVESTSMGKYQKGEHVKVETLSEWMWLLVYESDARYAFVSSANQMSGFCSNSQHRLQHRSSPKNLER
jgi:hypothetical protein